MLKLKLQYFGHLMRRGDSLEMTLMMGGTEGRRRRGLQRMPSKESYDQTRQHIKKQRHYFAGKSPSSQSYGFSSSHVVRAGL